LDHSITHEVVGSCQGATRIPEHKGISPADAARAAVSDDSSGSADEVELHRYPAVPAVAPALLSAATPAGLAVRGAPAVGRTMRATRNAHLHYASAAVRVPAQGVWGTLLKYITV
jgi:hypothetical protein